MRGPSQVAQEERIHLPMQEVQQLWVQFLGREDPVEEETAAHSSIPAWKIPWTEEPGGLLMGPPMDSGLLMGPPMDSGLLLGPPMDSGLLMGPPMDSGLLLGPPMDSGLLSP